jgi:Skp family chaperone for outer membrane proteins
MKRHFITLLVIFTIYSSVLAQKGARVGYIDMEYILQNVPAYTEAKNQLEQKAQSWKIELETKKSDIENLKSTLKSERVLLTKELIEEREEEIKFKETELADYQQKRFGPNGDLIVQKTLLTQPIQDQVFTAVQDISEAKKYDFVFDRSSDLTILFASKRFDISEQVLRVINRSSKREQLNKTQLKAQEEKDRKEDELLENPGGNEKQKLIEEKRAAREKALADKKAAVEARRKEAEENRQKLIQERLDKKNGTVSGNANTTIETQGTNNKETVPKADTSAADLAKEEARIEREAKKAAQQADFEARKKALEEKRLKTLADREAARKAKLEANPPKN